MPRAKGLPTQKWLRNKTYIHINQGNIQASNKLRLSAIKGELPEAQALAQMPDVITVKHNQSNRYGSTVILRCPETGRELARFAHDPFRPYSCGAQLVCITELQVEVVSRHPEGTPLSLGCPIGNNS